METGDIVKICYGIRFFEVMEFGTPNGSLHIVGVNDFDKRKSSFPQLLLAGSTTG